MYNCTKLCKCNMVRHVLALKLHTSDVDDADHFDVGRKEHFGAEFLVFIHERDIINLHDAPEKIHVRYIAGHIRTLPVPPAQSTSQQLREVKGTKSD